MFCVLITDVATPQSIFGQGLELLWESVQDHAPVTAEIADQVYSGAIATRTTKIIGTVVVLSKSVINSFTQVESGGTIYVVLRSRCSLLQTFGRMFWRVVVTLLLLSSKSMSTRLVSRSVVPLERIFWFAMTQFLFFPFGWYLLRYDRGLDHNHQLLQARKLIDERLTCRFDNITSTKLQLCQSQILCAQCMQPIPVPSPL